MTLSAAQIRAEAEALARQLPELALGARTATTLHSGAAGRKRAGTGEDFWQYRRHATEDGSTRIDWRRSAKGDQLFVRETELEAARLFHLWVDPSKGFGWKSPGASETKADRARIIFLAVASELSRDGERIGVLGGQKAGFGSRALDRAAEDFLRQSPSPDPIAAPKTAGIALVASDFYDPKPDWLDRLSALAARCPEGILLSVADPQEIQFDYSGRVEFSRPGTEQRRLIERSESIRSAYVERLQRHHRELDDLSRQIGWPLIRHVTSDPARDAAAQLVQLLATLGTKDGRAVG